MPAFDAVLTGNYGGGIGSGGSFRGAGLFASRPQSGLTTGDTMRFTDIGRAPGTTFQWDGTAWRSLTGRYVLGESGTAIFVNSTTELATPSIRQLIPQELLPIGARLTLMITVDKGNTSTAGVGRARFGTAGSSSDTEVTPSGGVNFPSSSSASGNLIQVYRLDSLTTLRPIGAGNAAGNVYKINGNNSAAAATAVTVSDVSADDMYFSFNAYCSADVNTYIRDWQIIVED